MGEPVLPQAPTVTTSMPRRGTSGKQVNWKAFREGWDRIFGPKNEEKE